MASTVRLALAGIGGYGEAYIEALLPRLASLDARIVAVADPQPQRCRRLADLVEAKIPIHAKVDELFAGADRPIDLMLIVTPIHLHAEHTCLALRNGAHVLCEKPLAGTLIDALRMHDADAEASARGQFTAIGYQWSFSQAVQSLKRAILGGQFGRPLRMRTMVHQPRAMGYFRRNDWAGRIRTADGHSVFDSPVNNGAAHFLHNMFYLLGPTRETSAMPAWVQAELYRANAIENYDTAAVRCQTQCGVEVLFYATHATEERRGPRCRFEFEDAVVEFDALAAGQFVARWRDGRVRSFGHPNLDRHEKIWQAIDSVRNGGAMACGVPAAMAHTLCVAAAQESAIQIVDFPQRLKRDTPLDGDTMIAIERLGEHFTECYQRGMLPAEHPELTWARAGTRVDVDPGNQPGTLAKSPAGAVSVHVNPAVIAGVAGSPPPTPIVGA